MGFVRGVLVLIGVLATLMGLLWIGQGSGYIHWPESSFMLDQRPWAYRGVALALFGLIVVFASRKLGRGSR